MEHIQLCSGYFLSFDTEIEVNPIQQQDDIFFNPTGCFDPPQKEHSELDKLSLPAHYVQLPWLTFLPFYFRSVRKQN